jgi:methionyl-tRNA synthetase
VRQEQFLTDKERGADGQFGSEWGEIEFREEENYYFKLSQYKEWLLQYLSKRTDAVIPDFRQTELRNAVEKISGDLCISRPKSRLDWGIELPFDKDFVTYVWFDALTNYISFAGYDPNARAVATGLRPVGTVRSSVSLGTAHRAVATTDFDAQPQEFRDRWSKDTLQIIGKDILVPAHGIYWLIMLHAIGFPDEAMPQLLVHGWWNLGGAKMSKSAGNIIDPFVLADKYGADALRYYLMSDIATGKDADFSEERLVERYNTDLANSLGNLLNRALPMVDRYRQRRIARIVKERRDIELPENEVHEMIRRYLGDDERLIERFGKEIFVSVTYLPGWAYQTSQMLVYLMEGDENHTSEFAVEMALRFLQKFIGTCNQAIDLRKPWILAKEKGSQEQLDEVLYQVVESLRIIAILISPVLPRAAHGIFDQLNWKMELSGKEERFSLAEAEWGRLPDGHIVGKPVPLFPRIEL